MAHPSWPPEQKASELHPRPFWATVPRRWAMLVPAIPSFPVETTIVLVVLLPPTAPIRAASVQGRDGDTPATVLTIGLVTLIPLVHPLAASAVPLLIARLGLMAVMGSVLVLGHPIGPAKEDRPPQIPWSADA